MNPNKINSQTTAGNFELEKVLKEMAQSMGVPLITGNIYFVVPAANDNSVQFNKYYNKKYEDGTEMVQTTLALALAACTANRGDVIFLAPGFALTVTSSNVDLNKAGVTIIGLGNGLKRPTFTFGAAAATMTVSAADVTIKNCHHIGNFQNVASAYTLAAAKDFNLLNCSFADNSTVLNFLSAVVTNATDNAADGLTVMDCRYQGLATTENAFVSVLAALNRIHLENNSVFKDATNNAGQFITLSSKIILAARIMKNYLVIVGATGTTVGIFLTGSGTTSKGIVHDNFCSSLDTTTELMFTAGTGLVFFRNEYTGVADKSGYIVPAIDSSA